MTFEQRVFASLTVVAIFLVILSLIRRGKLREEFSWLWLLTGAALLLLVYIDGLLAGLTRLIGAVAPTTTLFIFGIVFLMFLSMHLAIRLSRVSNDLKNLTQAFSLHLSETSRQAHGAPSPDDNRSTQSADGRKQE